MRPGFRRWPVVAGEESEGSADNCIMTGFFCGSGRPIGCRAGIDPARETSPLFERGVILAPVADAERGLLFHGRKSLLRHLIRNSSLRFVQQSPLHI